MGKIFVLLTTMLLLNGCAESVALLGTSAGSASNGKMLQSSINSAISYGIKQQTGKTPLGHVLAYADEKNPEKRKETCFSFIERTRSEFCTIVKKQMSLTNTVVKKKTLEIVKQYPKNNKTKDIALRIEKNFLNGFFQIKNSPRKLAIDFQAKIEESNNKKINQYLIRR